MSAMFAGRRALVTGAAQGLGRAFALALADEGAAVAACDISPEISALEAELTRRGASSYLAVADVSDPSAVRSFVDAAAAALGGLDLVVSNAGSMRATSLESDSWDQAIADFDHVVGVNYRGPYLVGRAAIPHLIAAGGGDIINVTTDHIHTCGYPFVISHDDAQDCRWKDRQRGPSGGARFDVYDSSKWALKGLTNVWARALGPHRIRVNSFGMGATATPMYLGHLGGTPPRPGTMQPEAVAAILVELLAEGPAGRTGDCVQIWAGHPTRLPPVSLEGLLAAQDLGRD